MAVHLKYAARVDLSAVQAGAWQRCDQPSIIYQTDTGLIAAVNDAAKRIFGFKDDVVGMPIVHVFPSQSTRFLARGFSDSVTGVGLSGGDESDFPYSVYWTKELEVKPTLPAFPRSGSADSPMSYSGSPSRRDRKFGVHLQHSLGGRITALEAAVLELGLSASHPVMKSFGELKTNYTAITHLQQVQSGDMTLDPKMGSLRAKILSSDALSQSRVLLECPEALKDQALFLDWKQINYVLAQLISNAIRFDTSERPVVVKISSPSPKTLEFNIVDQGPGIDLVYLKALLSDTLYTEEAAGVAFKSGGLKLETCKSMVLAMGGTFDATTTPGKGSSFTFSVSSFDPFTMGRRSSGGSSVDYTDSRLPPLSKMAIAAGRTPYLGMRRFSSEGTGGAAAIVAKATESPLRANHYLDETALIGVTSEDEHHPFGVPTIAERVSSDVLDVVRTAPRLRRKALDVAVLRAFREEHLIAEAKATAAFLAEREDAVRVSEVEAPSVVEETRSSVNEPVLVVDDEPGSRRLLKRFLLRLGFTNIEEANGGLPAVAMAKTKRYAVILMDQQMPDLTGDQAAIQIRNWENSPTGWPHTPAIVCSSNTAASDMAIYRAAGMEEDTCPKPFDIGILKGILSKHFYDLTM